MGTALGKFTRASVNPMPSGPAAKTTTASSSGRRDTTALTGVDLQRRRAIQRIWPVDHRPAAAFRVREGNRALSATAMGFRVFYSEQRLAPADRQRSWARRALDPTVQGLDGSTPSPCTPERSAPGDGLRGHLAGHDSYCTRSPYIFLYGCGSFDGRLSDGERLSSSRAATAATPIAGIGGSAAASSARPR